jgi:hypothetical protein
MWGVGEDGKGKEHTTQIAAQHKVEDKETVLVVLESIAQIDDEGVVDLGGMD